MITKEEFEIWKDNPITQAVMAVIEQAGEDAKTEFMEMVWESGRFDPQFYGLCVGAYKQAVIMVDWTFENFSMVSDDFEDVKEEIENV